MHLHQLVDVRDIHTGAGGNPLAARGVEQRGLAPLGARHRQDDRFLALQHAVVDVRHRFLGFAHAGHHAHDAAHAAHALHLAQLLGQVFEIELALLELRGHPLGFFGVHLLGRLLDEADDVALPEDSACDALGIERVEAVELFADAEELDRQAGDGAHGERCAAAPVAVHPCQDESGQRQAFVEAAGRLDRVLTREGVGDQKNFRGLSYCGDLGRLAHHLLVDRGAAGGVEEEDVIAADLGGLDRAAGDVGGQLARNDRQRGDQRTGLLGEDRELFHGRRAAHVERGEQDALLAAVGEAFGDLAGGGGFARALQAGHHHDRRGHIDAKVGFFLVRAEHVDEGIIDDLDDLLARADRADDFFADGAHAHLVDEVLDHRQRHVGLEQGYADFAQGFADVLFGQRAAPGQAVEDTAKAFAQGVEHRFRLLMTRKAEKPR